jgi:hypothetical protein
MSGCAVYRRVRKGGAGRSIGESNKKSPIDREVQRSLGRSQAIAAWCDDGVGVGICGVVMVARMAQVHPDWEKDGARECSWLRLDLREAL